MLRLGRHSAKSRGFTDEQISAAWDLLLLRLCGCDWTKEGLYAELGPAYVRTVCSAKTGFQFFGERLMAQHGYFMVQF